MITQLTEIKNKFFTYLKERCTWIAICAGLIVCIIANDLYYKTKLKNLNTEQEVYILKSQLANQKKDSIINSQGRTIQNQKAVVSDNQEAVNQISSEVFDLKTKDEKNLNTIAYWKDSTNILVKNLKAKFTDTIPLNIAKKDSAQLVAYINDSLIAVPKKAFIDSSDVKIYETITKTGFTLDSLKVPDNLSFRIVKNDGGFLKKDSYEFQSYHSNKYIVDAKQESLLFVPKGKGFLPYLIAAAVGAGTVLILK